MDIVVFDTENSGLDANFGITLCAVVKEVQRDFKGKVTTYRLDKYQTSARSDDSPLIKDIIGRLNEADVIIAHNGLKYDRPYLNTRALRWGQPVLNPRGMIIDPVRLARKHLKLTYNGLDQVASLLQTKHKKTTVDGNIWIKATLDRDKKAMDYIVEHCIADVDVLEEVAYRLRKFVGGINAWGSD